jgi:hypothetical protein
MAEAGALAASGCAIGVCGDSMGSRGEQGRRSGVRAARVDGHQKIIELLQGRQASELAPFSLCLAA